VTRRSVWFSDVAILIYMALGTVVVHLLTGDRYGFQRDELATLDDARHLAWGYVAYPPVTPFFGRLSLLLFGTSLAGFRFFAALAEAAAVVLTGLMARELGGHRAAQFVAAAAAVPFCLGGGALMQYVSFDYLCWVLTAYVVLQLLKSDDPRWWIAIGCAIGLGMLSKYTMAFFAAGFTAGVLLTDARRYLASKWLWLGIAAAILIFLPNFIWQAQHGFVSLDFLRHIHERDVGLGRANYFLPDQLKLTLLGFPLYAAGAVWSEQWLASRHRPFVGALRAIVSAVLIADMFIASAVTLPIAPINSTWWRIAVKLNEDFPEEIGWPELVETVAKIHDSLPPEDRAHLGILGTNYGEAGAINLYGPRYGLPPAISGVNSFWQRGYGNPPPETLIVVGLSRGFLETKFATCEVVGHTWNRYGVENEETRRHPDIFVCRHLRESWPEFWRSFRYFG